MRIDLIEGPIGADLLGHICRLYGETTDCRYADIKFTRKVFNENPSGRSYHAFVQDGDEVVGCYGIIPICVTAKGRKVWAGKGEALYVRKEYGASALFLINSAVNFATIHGLEFIFGITHERLGYMLQKLGFTAIPGALQERFHLLRPCNSQMLNTSRLQLNAAHFVTAAQAFIYTAVMASIAGAQLSVDVNWEDNRDYVFRLISDATPASSSRWIAALDKESLCWFNDLGKIDVLSVNGSADEFVVVERPSRGGHSEILRWHIRKGSLRRALQVLRFVIEKAHQEGASALTVGANADISGKKDLRIALSLLGFIPRRVPRTLYVKACDPYYTDSKNVDLSGLVSI